MTMTDPIADLLTRIRNANSTMKSQVKIPHSKIKSNILSVMKKHGFIKDYESELVDGFATLKVQLKYGPDGEKIINHIQRVSKPGCRIYVGVDDIPNPLNGLGLAILSTSQGIVGQLEAKRRRVGGEVICEVW